MFHFVLFSLESCWQSAPYHVFLTSMQRFRNRVNIEFGVYLDDSHGKESACIARDLGLIPGSRRSPGEDKGLLIPVFLPGESHGQRSLVGCSPWPCKESDITERLTLSLLFSCSITLQQRRQWHPTPVLLPGESQGWRSLVGHSPWGREESDRTERLQFHFSLSCIGEGNGNPLQRSCLENPRDGGAWCAAVYGVAQSRPRLK